MDVKFLIEVTLVMVEGFVVYVISNSATLEVSPSYE